MAQVGDKGKAINWLASWYQTAEKTRHLIEGALVAKNIPHLRENHRPEIVDDRHRQMEVAFHQEDTRVAPNARAICPTTNPNNNPFVVSAFGTVKTAPEYPGRFLHQEDSSRYFDMYFVWFRTEHFYSAIDNGTSEHWDRDLREQIVANRREELQRQR
ncbi:MAG: hypothetical protein JSW12_18335 [Deltaproteobacteria bacterium]|nr:MAG: hypothetical protein JSW12_18335 [Deltaproteobacteria bacterium]